MENIELSILYQVSDFVAAALTYQKHNKNKNLISAAWTFVVFVLSIYFLPVFMFTLACIPFRSCSSADFWNLLKVASLTICSCGLVLFLTYSSFWNRIKTGYVTRLRFKRFNETYQETHKIILCEDGVELSYKTHKVTIYWKSFQQPLESDEVFLLPMKLYEYIIIPKRILSNPEEIKTVSKIITARTGYQIIST